MIALANSWSGQRVRKEHIHCSGVMRACLWATYSPLRDFVISSSADTTNMLQRKHHPYANCNYIATGSSDNRYSVRLWDVKCVQILVDHGVWYYHWRCHLVGDIWHLVTKMVPSWCGTVQGVTCSSFDGSQLMGVDPCFKVPILIWVNLKRKNVLKILIAWPVLVFKQFYPVWTSELWSFASCIWLSRLRCKIMGYCYKFKSVKTKRKLNTS